MARCRRLRGRSAGTSWLPVARSVVKSRPPTVRGVAVYGMRMGGEGGGEVTVGNWTISSHCSHCSLVGYPGVKDRYVVHPEGWCPRFYASVHVDTNCGESDAEGGFIYYTSARHASRPVEVGELVWMFDTGDGVDAPFASWARVTAANGRSIDLKPVGNARSNGFCYVDPGFIEGA